MRHLLVGEAVASGAARAIVVGVYNEGPFGPAGGMSLKMTKNTTRESKKTKGLDTDRLYASMDRTCGIGTSAILQFGLAPVDERTASLEIGLKL